MCEFNEKLNFHLHKTQNFCLFFQYAKFGVAALDILITSLMQSPFLDVLVPSLFYVLENALYWIQTEMSKDPSLSDAEVKLLKVSILAEYFRYLVLLMVKNIK